MNVENRPKHYLAAIVVFTILTFAGGVWIGYANSSQTQSSRLQDFLTGLIISTLPYTQFLSYIDRMIRHEMDEVVLQSSEAQKKELVDFFENREEQLKQKFFGSLDKELKELEIELKELEPPREIRNEVEDHLFQMKLKMRSFEDFQQSDEAILN